MTELYKLLSLKSNASKEEIRSKYYKSLSLLHPKTRETGNELKYIELQEAYKRFLKGDSLTNCYLVCTNEVREVSCRCGGTYSIQDGFEGQIDCEFCSCFIEVEGAAPKICQRHRNK